MFRWGVQEDGTDVWVCELPRLEAERFQTLCPSGEVMGGSVFVSENTSSVRSF